MNTNTKNNPTRPGHRYYPETRRWVSHFLPETPRTFAVHEQDESKPDCLGAKVATVTINAVMDDDSANRLATLIEHAPEVWRDFRDLNRYLLIDGDDASLDIFASVTKLLRDAAGRPPYGPAADPADEELYRRLSDKVVGGAGKGGSEGVARG